MASSASVVFLPWTRQGAAAAIQTVDTLGTQAGLVTLTAGVSINGGPPVEQPVRLLAPSDVTGIHPRAIVRREPPPGTIAFEDNHFAAIEFDRPDFAWLFTPARADASGRLRPWLVLIVVRQQEGVTVRPAVDASLPKLEIAAPAVVQDELPDLAESWLWAHGQVTSREHADADTLRATLAGDADLSLSRLLCPRVLQPDTAYVACLVPAFEAGRLAGLGLATAGATALQPAWSTAVAGVTLPVYDHWMFRTGSGGDFRTLVQKLHAEPAPEGLGRRPIDISTPGFELLPPIPAGTRLDLEGALQPLNADPATWPGGIAAVFQPALANVVNAAAPADGDDPLLAPPLYGRWHAARHTVELPEGDWFDELNLDPRHRAVAAYGTRVVQAHQEGLMASAWEQAGELQTANQRVRQLQLSLFVNTSLHRRHFARMEPDALLRVAAPALTRLRAALAPGDTEVRSLATAFEGVKVPLKAVTPAMRKLSRSRGPLNRRLTRAATVGVTMQAFLVQLNEATFTVATSPAPGIATFNTMGQASTLASMHRYPDVTADAVAAMPGAPQFRMQPEKVRIKMPVAGADVEPIDDAVAAAFRAAAVAHLEQLRPARPWILVFPVPHAMPLDDVRAQVRLQLEPRRTTVALARAVVPALDDGSAPDAAAVDTLMYAPKFPQPMYEPLRDLSQELLLPGLERVTPNSVLGLRTNRAFVRAYMVGLNVEMGRELLWRGFPTDQRGTYFDQFWDAAAAVTPRADIEPIHQWGSRPLGRNAGSVDDQFVMLLRSELLQRYPTAAIYAVPAVKVNGLRTPSEDPLAEVHPAFRGSLPPDVTFVGFDLTTSQVTLGDGYFIVIQEQPTEPRFGLESGVAPPGAYLETTAGAPAGVPLRGLEWRRNAAHMAGIVRRLPTRIAIHASRFISPGEPA